MAIAPVKKVQIISLKKNRNKLFEKIQDLACIELLESKKLNGSLESPSFAQDLKGLEEAILYLESYQEKSLFQSFLKEKLEIHQKELKELLKSFPYQELIKRINTIREELLTLKRERHLLLLDYELYFPWKDLEISFDSLKELFSTEQILGGLKKSKQPLLEKALKDKRLLYFLKHISTYKENSYFLIICLKENLTELNSLLKELDFSFLHLKGKDTPKEILRSIRSKLKEIEQRQALLTEEILSLRKERFKLMIIYDILRDELERINSQAKTISTQQTFLLEGWIRQKDIPSLLKALEEFRPQIEVFLYEPSAEESPPTFLENKELVRPFEVVTDLYGRPLYRGVDPTPFLAPFFIFSFAICLTDAGYGILLMLFSMLFLKKVSLSQKAKYFFRLFFMCGLATLFIGAFTGGWLGNIMEHLPLRFSFLAKTASAVKLLSPLEEPLKFLSLTLGLGILQVATGVMIRIVKDLKERDFFRFTFLSLPTLFIQMSLLIILLAVLGILPNSFMMVSFVVFLIACLLVVIFQFLKNKGFLLKLFWSFFGLYNIITGNFLADTLSFSRLFALGLTTGLLAMAINEIVFIIPQILEALKIPLFISIVLGAGIFLVGHLLNFLINCLSAYVHTSRLQYLEFFSKFFEGPGRTFKPFKRQYRYIRVT